ncbi:MAG: undecaprenyldiphospho-muramoylpentapeptide beta-N-acetylglucosaminyltransferase [Syntrophomonadaceae bacterium]|nr:undecaprenyldiphospho-muramoylpentapeptide beta-N-acetylglucosaminyltransferase [Syntrophomonadaceae bacterium]
MKAIITGGGTGGHIYPALAIAKELCRRKPDMDILYVGSKGMESRIVPEAGFNFVAIDVSGIDRSSMLKASKSLVKFPYSFFQARDIIKKFQPDFVLGTGGYVSFPVVLAGTYFAPKTFIHEQNAYPGLANRILAKRVDCTMLTFAEAQEYLEAKRIKITGLPVRQEFFEVTPEAARKALGLEDNWFTLIAFGGSRGAASINRAMLEAVDRLQDKKMQIIWITGWDSYEDLSQQVKERLTADHKARIRMLPYMNNIEQAMAAAHLAVCRAGASTLAELAILGLPAILVPYPYAAENHQEKNARALVEKNAEAMVIDEFLDGDTLVKTVESLRSEPERLSNMRQQMLKEAKPHALDDIIAELLN